MEQLLLQLQGSGAQQNPSKYNSPAAATQIVALVKSVGKKWN